MTDEDRREAFRQRVLAKQASQPPAWVPAAPVVIELVVDPLTPRQNEVLELWKQGATNRDIAAAMSISTETAKTFARQIFQRLNARNRAHALAIAQAVAVTTSGDTEAGEGTAVEGFTPRCQWRRFIDTGARTPQPLPR